MINLGKVKVEMSTVEVMPIVEGAPPDGGVVLVERIDQSTKPYLVSSLEGGIFAVRSMEDATLLPVWKGTSAEIALVLQDLARGLEPRCKP